MSLIDGIYWQNVYDADKPKEKIPETNYQRVMRKTPEELAEWFSNRVVADGVECPPQHGYKHCLEQDGCRACWLDWLRQEAE